MQIGATNEGKVIGSGGSVIKDIESKTGAQVKVQKGMGTVTICGFKRDAIDAAKAMVEAIVLQATGGVGIRREGEVSERISVSKRGGLIVGPGGQNIRSIKEESGADVQVTLEPYALNPKP